MPGFDFGRVKSADQPQNNLETMIDVESLGTTAGSPVVTIGATLFDPYSTDSGEELMRRAVLLRIDMADAVDQADHVEGGTIRWWFEQEDAAIKALVAGDDEFLTMKTALTMLWQYCVERGRFVDNLFFEGLADMPKACRYWAKDPDFDMRLLEFFYQKLGLHMPWKFWENRSVRTIQDLAWPNGDRPDFEVPGVAHDARWDAVTQAMLVQAAMRRLGLAKDQDVKFAAWGGND